MAFLDCYIWEVNKFPRYGSNYDRHTISNVFYHNSETMDKFQNNNVAIEIPEFKLIGTDEQKLEAFKQTLHQIKRRLDIFTSLPLTSLSKMVLELIFLLSKLPLILEIFQLLYG